MSASKEARIAKHDAAPIPPTSPAYDQVPLVHKAAMIRMRDDIPEEDMPPRRRFVLTTPPPGCDVAEIYDVAARPPRGQYDFVDTIETGQGLIRSLDDDARTIARVVDKAEDVGFGLIRSLDDDARTIARAIDKAEDVGFVRALQDSEHKMMTSLEEVSLSVSYQAQDSEHKMMTSLEEVSLSVSYQAQRTAYETELHEVRQAYLGFEAQNRALLVRLETLETHMRTLKKKMTDKYCPKGEIKKLEIKLWNLKVRGNNVAAYTQCFQELSWICTKFLADETKKINKYIGGIPNNIHGNVMSARPKTLDDAIEPVIHQKNQQQQPHKKQNVARAYTAGPGEKKAYTGNCKRYGHTTSDCRVNTNNNNNNKNQNAGACYKCGNTRNIKRNCPKLKNSRNGNGNEIAQGRAYALGGRYASPDPIVITGTFLLNNRYATILFDTGTDKSFVSTTFSALINITPTALENHYDVELVDGKIIGVNIIIRGCTLNFMKHPFNIDLMPIPLGSFDVIIRIDWLTKYHGVVICDEKIVCVSFGREMLIFQGSQRQVRGKRLEDVLIFRDFPEVFLEDLPGILPTRQVKFQIDLVPGAAPVVQAPYQLAPFKMKELAKQLQELSGEGFI
nr:hypothetical protein [Tanacetum cinerariifolium]